MKNSSITLKNGKVVEIELVDAIDSTYQNNDIKSIRVLSQDGKYECDSIIVDEKFLAEDDSIEEQCKFNLCSYSKAERIEIANLLSQINF